MSLKQSSAGTNNKRTVNSVRSPVISVIMPVYNTPQDFLRAAIDSILSQTFTDFEFIIVDDGSTDPNVKRIIKSYNDGRIRYIRKKNSGITKTLLHGLKYARGEFIARMDADDISLPQRFATQVDFLRTHPDISIVGAFLEMFPTYHIVEYPLRPTILDMIPGPAVGHPVVMWRRADFEKYDLHYDPQFPFAQDYELWSRAIRFVKFANIPTVLLKYRYGSHNVSHTHREKQRAIAAHVRQTTLDFLTADKSVQSRIYDICIHGPEPGTRPLSPTAGRIICWFIPRRRWRHMFKDKYVHRGKK